MSESDNTETKLNRIPDAKGRMVFPPGVSGNPNGRPKGTISVITRLKQMFEEDPQEFEDFVMNYKTNKDNQKHIVEMIDGKPNQKTELTGNLDLRTVILPEREIEQLNEQVDTDQETTGST